MLPIPFEKYIPKIFRRDTKLLALTDKVDTHLTAWKNDILALKHNADPLSIGSSLVDDLGALLSPGFLDVDSSTIKRRKIATAVRSHRYHATFVYDVKLKIDAVVGGDSYLYTSLNENDDDWIICGDGISPIAGSFYAILGGDGVATDYGIRIVGNDLEAGTTGVVEIDVDDNSLSADEVLQVVQSIENDIPVFMRVFLGYLSAGSFVRYANGQIH